jgi:uncharacterized membrane protein YccF (DUF307 family)
MNPVALLLNILWLVCGGLMMAAGWMAAGIVMALTIVGLPWTRAAFSIARYAISPFGHRAVSRASWRGREDIGTGPLGTFGNLIWFLAAGWWLALGHLAAAAFLAATIIGIPFAWAHLKLASMALWPIGRQIVSADDYPPAYARYR